jgi:hypothetical protein
VLAITIIGEVLVVLMAMGIDISVISIIMRTMGLMVRLRPREQRVIRREYQPLAW